MVDVVVASPVVQVDVGLGDDGGVIVCTVV